MFNKKEEVTQLGFGEDFGKDERGLEKLHKGANSRYPGGSQRELIRVGVKNNTKLLRDEIGLPIARGRGPVYKSAVRDIVDNDVTGVFHEFDMQYGHITPELRKKIDKLKGQIKEVFDPKIKQKDQFRKLGEITGKK